MKIYRQGSWKVKIHKIDQTKIARDGTNGVSDIDKKGYVDELIDETI